MLQYKHMRYTYANKIKFFLFAPLIALAINFFAAPLMQTANAVEIETIEATASCPEGTEYLEKGVLSTEVIGPGCAKKGSLLIVASPSYSCPAGYKQMEEGGKTVCKGSAEIAKIAYEAATEDLLKQAPNLKNYTSDPNVIGPCLLQLENLKPALYLSAIPNKNVQRDYIANCLAGKTGASKDDIKNTLGDADVAASAKKGGDAAAPFLAQIDQDEEGKPECGEKVEGLGYLICPILEHAARFSDSMWGLFEALLFVDPLTNNTDDSIYKTWIVLRDLANVILAIIFIAVIMSQISNVGISNYGIKKILPRLIIAAIVINVSYFLMQVLIDVANIAGKSFDDFLSSQTSLDYTKVSGWEKIVEDIVVSGTLALVTIGGATAGIAAVGGPAALLFILLLIIPAILGLLAGVFALMFRASIIPVLAIVSPMAIAAWVLPNTQKLFDKWRDIFSGLLFLYPLSSIYYGCLKFMAITVFLNGTSSTGQRLMALITLAVGIFAVAIFAVKSNSIMGRMVNGIMRVANKVTAPATNAMAGYAGALAGATRGRKKAEFLAQDHSKGVANSRHRGIFNPFRYASRAKHAIGRQMQRNEDTINLSKIQEDAFKESTNQRLREKILADPSAALGAAANTTAGKAFVSNLAYKNAETEIKGKYNGDYVRALNSGNEYVRALAAEELSKSAYGTTALRSYLDNGGTIDSARMAQALMDGKKTDAGLAAAGTEALQRLQQVNPRTGAPMTSSVTFNSSEMASFSQQGFANASREVVANQSPASIEAAANAGDVDWKRVAEVLNDDRLTKGATPASLKALESAINKSIQNKASSGSMSWEHAAGTLADKGAIKFASSAATGGLKTAIDSGISGEIASGNMSPKRALKALDNKHVAGSLSPTTRKSLESIVDQATAPASAAPAASAPPPPPQTQTPAAQPPSVGAQPQTRQGFNQSLRPTPQHIYDSSQQPPSAPPPPPART